MSDIPYTGQGTTGTSGGVHRVACLFETRAVAERAADDLVTSGISRSSLDIVDQAASTTTTTTTTTTGETGGGLWESIKNLFAGDDADGYYEGVHRGHVLLTVRAGSQAEADRITTILERHDPLDIDAQESSWRAQGWTGGIAKPVAPVAATGASAMAGRATTATSTSGDEVIPLVTEDVAIGKRTVAGGTVRVRTHVIETPVTESVRLHDERVHIERRPVDRAVNVPGDAFRERSIEMTESHEEAVVAKTARVTEEVVVRKDATERTEQVSETVRRTELDVDDVRKETLGTTSVTGTSSVTGTTSVTGTAGVTGATGPTVRGGDPARRS